MPTVSLIATVLNEAESIGRLLDSIGAQTRPPDEVVLVDGGSRDDTVRRIEAWGAQQPFAVRVLTVPGANISQGRNAAIGAASGPVIASTDAGVRLDPVWLAELLEPFDAPNPPAVVGGFFQPDPRNAFETAMSATVLPAFADVDPRTFLPSSRSIAFTKEAWSAVGGYPEWLDYCEDLIFDLGLRARYEFGFAPQAVAHFRPRGNLRSFFKQYYLYARGDGKADLWRKRHAIRYATYLVAAPALVVLAVLASPWWWLALALGVAAYTRAPYRRLAPHLGRLGPGARLYALVMVPVIRVVGDLAKMIGYPVGVWWRLTRQSGRT
ncbi:MAG: glycosyltransferase [Chloroflexi bacterium]|nr:glycosyltransferase [Chloroflexota bacterium]